MLLSSCRPRFGFFAAAHALGSVAARPAFSIPTLTLARSLASSSSTASPTDDAAKIPPTTTTTTTTTAAAEPATATAAATAAATPKPPMMPFNEYCKAKTVHNMASNIAGVPVAIGSILLNSWVFVMVFPEVYDGSVPQDQLPQFFGLDLMVIAGMTGMASAVLGFAGGKWLYSQAYALLAPARARQMDARHADFVDRITTRRHATTSMSDDYYGDKIKSLSDYRKWLRVQHKRGKEPANDALRDPFADFGKKKQ